MFLLSFTLRRFLKGIPAGGQARALLRRVLLPPPARIVEYRIASPVWLVLLVPEALYGGRKVKTEIRGIQLWARRKNDGYCNNRGVCENSVFRRPMMIVSMRKHDGMVGCN